MKAVLVRRLSPSTLVMFFKRHHRTVQMRPELRSDCCGLLIVTHQSTRVCKTLPFVHIRHSSLSERAGSGGFRRARRRTFRCRFAEKNLLSDTRQWQSSTAQSDASITNRLDHAVDHAGGLCPHLFDQLSPLESACELLLSQAMDSTSLSPSRCTLSRTDPGTRASQSK